MYARDRAFALLSLRLIDGSFPPVLVVSDAKHHVIGCVVRLVVGVVVALQREHLELLERSVCVINHRSSAIACNGELARDNANRHCLQGYLQQAVARISMVLRWPGHPPTREGRRLDSCPGHHNSGAISVRTHQTQPSRDALLSSIDRTGKPAPSANSFTRTGVRGWWRNQELACRS
jgi:hypothetical protein